jgi:hypothetical protein
MPHDPATGAPTRAPSESVHLGNPNAEPRPFGVSPREHAGLPPLVSQAGYPTGVYNDPSSATRQLLCMRGAFEWDGTDVTWTTDGDAPGVLALLALSDGKIRIWYEGCRATAKEGEIVTIREGQRFVPMTPEGPRRIAHLFRSGTTARLMALPCGAIGAFGRRATERTLAATERALRGEGRLVCPVCKGGQETLMPWTQPPDEEVSAPVLWQLPYFGGTPTPGQIIAP